MSARLSYLAVDLGASSGRVMECRWDGSRFHLEELHRFPNGGVRVGASLHWDALRLWSEIQTGLQKFRVLRGEPPAGIGVDAWGVDFALLDERDRLLGNPFHYRDARTRGLPTRLSSVLNARDLFRATGVETMEINTAFQLASMAAAGDPQLQCAHTLLMMPDLFQFLLCGEKRVEFTEASTTQLYNLRAGRWSRETMSAFGIPSHIFPEIAMPGTVLGEARASMASDAGFAQPFPCISVASHDTASAVAAIPGLDESSIFLSSGTWSLIGATAPEPNLSDAAFAGGFTNEGSADCAALLMKNLTGLWILQECVRAWEAAGNRCEWARLEQAAAAAEPFRSLIDPSSPDFSSPADMCAAVARHCARTDQPPPATPGETARCVFESLSLAYRSAVEELDRLAGRRHAAIRVVGGGSLNRVLCQMTADACGRPVVAGPVEAAALGNAMAQAVATGQLRNFAEGREAIGRSVACETYQPSATHGWDEAFEQYKSIVNGERERVLNDA
jgi:rhamnulokinase